MENQHRKITGYRELSQEEINLMNQVKAAGGDLQKLLTAVHDANLAAPSEGVDKADASRWHSIAKTHFQQGLMALTRAVAKPDFF